MKSTTIDKGLKATEALLTEGEGLLSQIIQDFTPDNNGKVKGVRLSTAAKAIGFVVSHPITTFNLFRFARSSKKLKPETLEAVIKNDIIWNFVQSHADALPAAGAMLAKFGMQEFQEGNILEHKALNSIKEVFKKKENLNLVRDILLEPLKESPNWNVVAEKGLTVLSDDNFSKYFKDKGHAIRDYITSGPKKELFQGYLKRFDIDKSLLEIAPNILTKIPEIKDVFISLVDEGLPHAALNALHMVNKDKELSEFFQKHPHVISKAAKGLIRETPNLKSVVESFKFDPELLGGIDILLKNPKLSKELVFLFHKEDWTGLASAISTNLGEPDLKHYVENNKKAIVELVEGLCEKVPVIKSRIPTHVDLRELIEIGIEKPKEISQIAKSLKAGGVSGVFAALQSGAQSFGVGLATPLANIAKGYFSNKPVKEQEIANDILKDVAASGESNFRQISGQLLDSKSPKLSVNTIFDYTNINPAQPLHLNTKIEGVSFVKSSFNNNVSFAGSEFVKTSFLDAKFSDPSIFKGAIIDGDTLKSLSKQVKAGAISLKGVTVIGHLAGMDLSGISLEGCDLSKATSLRNVNFKNTDFNGAVLPDANLFKESYNISPKAFHNGFITDDIITGNTDNVITKAVKNIASFSEKEGQEITYQSKKEIVDTLKNLINGSSKLGEHVKKSIQQNPGKKNPITNSGKLNNIADYQGTPELLTSIYESQGNPQELKVKLAANFLATGVNRELFDSGAGDGQNGYYIKKILEESLVEFAKVNKDIPIASLCTRLDLPKELAKEFNPTSKDLDNSAVAILNKNLSQNFLHVLNQNFSPYKLTEKEEKTVAIIAKEIGENLFGDGAHNTRRDDVKLIKKTIKGTLLDTKIANATIGESFISLRMENIIGDKDKKTGLTKLFHDASSYTTAGFLTGGIYLNPVKINSDFRGQLKELLVPLVPKSPPNKVGIAHKHTSRHTPRSNAPDMSKSSRSV
jgi:uncharacterized protein YjbI with pentapeptide repeats